MSPSHKVEAEAKATAMGTGCTNTKAVSKEEHPIESRTSSVYIVEVVGKTNGFGFVFVSMVVFGSHSYVSAPDPPVPDGLPPITTVSPEQISRTAEPASAVGNGEAVISSESDTVQDPD